MRHGREERGVLPLRPDFESLGMTIGAEVPALAGAREQILVRAGVAADAGEAVLQHAARKELVSDLCDDGAPWAILAREALVVDCLQAMQVV